jgi:hypothetical protein
MTCTRPAVTEEPLPASITAFFTKRILEADPDTFSFFGGRHHLTHQELEIQKLMEADLVKKIIAEHNEPLPVLRHICKECGAIIGDTLHDRPDKGMCARCWKVCHG